MTIGPPIVPEYCCSASGMSTGLIAVSVDGVTQVGTDGGQKPLVENVFRLPVAGTNQEQSFAVKVVRA